MKDCLPRAFSKPIFKEEDVETRPAGAKAATEAKAATTDRARNISDYIKI